MTAPGCFLVLEGLDGAGTTTQTERLVAWLAGRGRGVHATREPSDGPIGKLIRRLLRGEEGSADPAALALLFAADRVDHLDREIRPALAQGKDVVSDRYLLSSLAYQGIENEAGWVEAINSRADAPDLTLLVEVPVAVCLERMGSRGGARELYEREEFLERVAAAYRMRSAPLAEAGRLAVVDGTPPPDEVAARIRDEVSSRFGR